MPNAGQVIGSSWERLASLTAGTDYDVQNVGQTTIYLIEVSGTDAPDDDEFVNANVLPPYWGTTVSEGGSTSVWAKAQLGGGRLTINEAE